ncbi:YopX family protein [Enterococcus raffinosus]|nr:YopX family protein [Enterococcus raffinosus]MDT2536453.1 YopX family protein [Enterococcus raffinosus]MDT2546944.1 YopX family protein [Enterococcus raffinosus]MDT2555657.1 YopX family protein [Enterococcus raffinosus]MDT2580436.1 YopX family protein [Enterococcus raffinosus]
MIPNFKAWDKYHEMMVSIISFDFENKIAYVEQENGDRYDIHFDNLIFLQSTGLKDKNGVEIFEGDIVSVRNHPFQKTELSGAGIEIDGDYLIGWSDHNLTWLAGDLLLYQLKPYIEVIGNIYENPELLEVE